MINLRLPKEVGSHIDWQLQRFQGHQLNCQTHLPWFNSPMVLFTFHKHTKHHNNNQFFLNFPNASRITQVILSTIPSITGFEWNYVRRLYKKKIGKCLECQYSNCCVLKRGICLLMWNCLVWIVGCGKMQKILYAGLPNRLLVSRRKGHLANEYLYQKLLLLTCYKQAQ